ncbi:MAG: IPT/TIG domain-containing protein, partial [Planctomycetota bacterium]
MTSLLPGLGSARRAPTWRLFAVWFALGLLFASCANMGYAQSVPAPGNLGDAAEDADGFGLDGRIGDAPAAPSAVHCRPEVASVRVTWVNNDEYEEIHVVRDGRLHAVLSGRTIEFVDAVLDGDEGVHVYAVQGLIRNHAVESPSCSVLVSDALDLVWAPPATIGGATDSGAALLDALGENGRNARLVRTLPDLESLVGIESIWVTLGTFPHNHVLTEGDAAVLLDFLALPGARVIYLEGGDTWVDDPPTGLHAAFGIHGFDVGQGDLAQQVSPGDLECWSFPDLDYEGEEFGIDRLEATPGAMVLLQNAAPAFATVVMQTTPQGGRAVGASHEFGALLAGDEGRSAVLRQYLTCFDLTPGSPVPPPPPPPHGAQAASAAVPFGGPLPTANVQSGTATSTANGTVTVNIAAVDPSRAFLIFQTRHNSNRPVGSMLRGRIATATTIEFVRVTNESPAVTMNIQWYVIEYSSGISVQRGSIGQASTSFTTPITPVASASDAFVTWSKTPAASDVDFGSNDLVLVEVPPPPATPDHLNFRTQGTGPGHTIWWELVEFTDPALVNVQRGSTALTGSTLTVDITLSTAVDVSRSFVLAGFQSTGSGSDIGERMFRGQLINGSTVRFDRPVSGDNIEEISWQVVELFDGSAVQRGSTSLGTGVSQTAVSIASVELDRAVAFSAVQPVGGQNMGRTSYIGNDTIGVGSVTMNLSSPTTLTIQRNATPSATDVGWFVVEWGSGEPGPDLVSVSPTSGTPLGGTSVTLTGTGFIAGTTVTFGGTPAASVTFVNATTLTAVTPAHASGSVDVVVTNVNGTDTLINGFTFNNGPDLVSVSPTSGTPLGGTSVTLTGTGFIAGTTVTFGGTPAASVMFVNATTLTAVTPAHASGVVDVVVTNTNGTDTLVGGFTFNNGPDLVSVSPTSGTPLGGTSVTLTGTGFIAGTAVTFGGTPAASVTFVNATTLTAVTPAHASGVVDVVVTNTNGTDTLTNGFTFNNGPDLVSVSPTSGTPLGGTSVYLKCGVLGSG